MMRSLALALLLACGACAMSESDKAFARECERAGGFYTYKGAVPADLGRYVCAKEITPPVTPEADDRLPRKPAP